MHRLVFVSKIGCELCWSLREKFKDVIDDKAVTLRDVEVKVRVEEAPYRPMKRACIWKAVDALKAVTCVITFILEAANFAIHDATSLNLSDQIALNTVCVRRSL